MRFEIAGDSKLPGFEKARDWRWARFEMAVNLKKLGFEIVGDLRQSVSRCRGIQGRRNSR